MEFSMVKCENPDFPECLCEACKDFFENGLGLFDEDDKEDNLHTWGGE
jgi:hypothetical protein